MNDNICVFGFLQGTLKSLNQMMGQFPDKSYSICQQNFLGSND